MNANDKTEKVLREIHILLSKSEHYNKEPSKVIVDKQQMIDLLSFLFRLHGKRMELAHGSRLTAVGVNGNLHNYLLRRLPNAPDFYILS